MTTINYLPKSEFTRPRNNWESGSTLIERIAYFSGPPNEKGCVEWTGAFSDNGRPTIKIGLRTVSVTRLVWIRHKGRIPIGKIIRHVVCANKRCINVDHFALGTHFENARDRDMDGKTARGAEHYAALLTEAQVREILLWKESHVAAARKYGVAKSTIANIRNGTKWAHIPRPDLKVDT